LSKCPDSVERLYEKAMDCTACFVGESGLHLPTIDLPQPRWVGPEYWTSSPRVLVVMLNPGQGDGSQLEQNLRLKNLLHQYKQHQIGFSAVLNFQREHMHIWGRPQGRFLPFYTTSLELDLDAIGFINIALCATKENKYPRSMLSRCFEAHTAFIAHELQPNVVLLSGSGTHSFSGDFRRVLPHAELVPMLHFAHRGGGEIEVRELSRVRELLAAFGQTQKLDETYERI
jgi:hypothetical protein